MIRVWRSCFWKSFFLWHLDFLLCRRLETSFLISTFVIVCLCFGFDFWLHYLPSAHFICLVWSFYFLHPSGRDHGCFLRQAHCFRYRPRAPSLLFNQYYSIGTSNIHLSTGRLIVCIFYKFLEVLRYDQNSL